ncbi:MAG: M23 family metallopeptidase [Prochloraceae cyanobacterium]|nr:M23 family metallopeptidase [Prochloraceae cyanobacterium]
MFIFSLPAKLPTPLKALAIAAGSSIVCNPLLALEVQIQPANPRIGETISVTVETEESPDTLKVIGKEKAYPVFPLAGQKNRYRALIPTTPLDRAGKIQIEVSDDSESKKIPVWLGDRNFPVQRITLSGKASAGATKHELERVRAFKKTVSPKKYWQGKFLRPNISKVTTVFGVRRYYNGKFASNYYHGGVDYAGNYGSPILAPATGKVILIGKEARGFRVHGNTVGIDHGQGVLSIFLHLSRIDVKEGDTVKAGQKIGTVGSTGASTGPHLHWGLFVNGVAVDPVPWRFSGIE